MQLVCYLSPLTFVFTVWKSLKRGTATGPAESKGSDEDPRPPKKKKKKGTYHVVIKFINLALTSCSGYRGFHSDYKVWLALGKSSRQPTSPSVPVSRHAHSPEAKAKRQAGEATDNFTAHARQTPRCRQRGPRTPSSCFKAEA